MKSNYIFIIAVLMLSNGVTAKQICDDIEPLYSVAPTYPALEAIRPHEGYVVVEFGISYDGTIFWSNVVKSVSLPTNGFKEGFERSSIIAIDQWKFNTRTISCNSKMKFTFTLEQ
jgi:TonB family protein